MILTPFKGHFRAFKRYFSLFKVKWKNIGHYGVLKCIINCFYQLVFNFSQFLDFKLTYLLKYCKFSDSDPLLTHFKGHFRGLNKHFYPLWANKVTWGYFLCLKLIKIHYNNLCSYLVVFTLLVWCISLVLYIFVIFSRFGDY